MKKNNRRETLVIEKYKVDLSIMNGGDIEFVKIASFIGERITELSVFESVVVLQILAYYTSVGKGNDPDQPRNLSKSVTVE